MAIDENATAAAANTGQARALKAVVAGLGLLIIVGLAAVFWRMFELASGRAGTPAAPAAASAAPASNHGDVTLPLPVGAQIRSTSLDQNRLAVHYDAPTGSGIAVLDLETGHVLTHVKAAPGADR